MRTLLAVGATLVAIMLLIAAGILAVNGSGSTAALCMIMGATVGAHVHINLRQPSLEERARAYRILTTGSSVPGVPSERNDFHAIDDAPPLMVNNQMPKTAAERRSNRNWN